MFDRQAYNKEYYEKHQEYHRAYARQRRKLTTAEHRAYNLKRKYGITSAAYDELWHAQNGRCAVCDTEAHECPKVGRSVAGCLVVDHDHATGNVRGLLCSACNVALGHMKDDPAILQSAISYLNKRV